MRGNRCAHHKALAQDISKLAAVDDQYNKKRIPIDLPGRNLMILLTFNQDGKEYLGVKTDQGILDIGAANRSLGQATQIDSPAAFYAIGLSALPELKRFVDLALAAEGREAWLLEEDRLVMGPCLPKPGKIICIGLNYRKHANEAKMELPEAPVLFAKY